MMDWIECNNKKVVKDVKLDTNLINSLIKSSRDKLESESMLKLIDKTASSKVSLAYDSLRELLEALSLKYGYKIYNHECYTAFLKEIIRENAMAEAFDTVRKVRNAVNYYGKDISIKEAEKVISDIIFIRNFIQKMLG